MSAQKLQQSFHYENCFVENKKNCKVKMLHRNFGVIISSHNSKEKKPFKIQHSEYFSATKKIQHKLGNN
jgi:hypothetical protein